MGMKGQERLRILAHMDSRFFWSREITRGILRYAATHYDVEVRLFGHGTASEKIADFRDWHPDGLIVGQLNEKIIANPVQAKCRAAVFAVPEVPGGLGIPCASVFIGNAAIAEGAAKHFAERRIRHFAFVGERHGSVIQGRDARYGSGGVGGSSAIARRDAASQGNAEWPWSAERDAAFRECARRMGCTYASFGPVRAAPNGGVRERRALAKWIAALPKPCGILAARDHVAVNILEVCREADIAVPQAVLVLGVDDDEFVCPHTPPSLSSVVIDYEGGGYLEAETLVALLRGEKKAKKLFYGISGVVTRQSTGDRNEARLMVSRAEEFIRKHAAVGGIGVEDVAKAVFASMRLLEMNFKAVTGGTVIAAIQDAKLGRVRALLTETQTPIGEIAALCGFESDGYLKELFRRRFGCTMREWRSRNR